MGKQAHHCKAQRLQKCMDVDMAGIEWNMLAGRQGRCHYSSTGSLHRLGGLYNHELL